MECAWLRIVAVAVLARDARLCAPVRRRRTNKKRTDSYRNRLHTVRGLLLLADRSINELPTSDRCCECWYSKPERRDTTSRTAQQRTFVLRLCGRCLLTMRPFRLSAGTCSRMLPGIKPERRHVGMASASGSLYRPHTNVHACIQWIYPARLTFNGLGCSKATPPRKPFSSHIAQVFDFPAERT